MFLLGHMRRFLQVLPVFLLLAGPLCAAQPKKKNKVVVVTTANCHLFKHPKTPFILVLKRGEPLKESIIECIEKMEIPSASVSGEGALQNPEVGIPTLDRKNFLKKKFAGVYVMVSLNGTVTQSSTNQTVAQIHVGFADADYRIFGGRLFSGEVGYTAEITIIPLPRPIIRKYDPQTGLGLLNSG